MLTVKEAKKIPFEQMDEESKAYYFNLFKNYVVRKQIADNNKALSSIFSGNSKTSLPHDYAGSFNQFNSAFVGENLIQYLNYHEIHTDFLSSLSEDSFNAYLHELGNSFNRKMALICFSHRESERIPNRVEFPVMVAYANMQTMVLNHAKNHPNSRIVDVFEYAADQVRLKFAQKNGYKISDSRVLDERPNYKNLGKKHAPIWKSMLDYYMRGLKDYKVLEAIAFVRDNFIFTEEYMGKYDAAIERASHRASIALNDKRLDAEDAKNNNQITEKDYDYISSTWFANDVYFDVMEKTINSIFYKYLSDPIFEDKTPKQKTEN